MGRPSLPRNKKPQLTAEQLRPVHHQSVPNFNQNKNDMGKRGHLNVDGVGCEKITDRLQKLARLVFLSNKMPRT